ncbi:hypothetical protein KBD81_00230 [Candidatus Woesebacteria bacterium]|nr:hypothetical protein [Candidatus Woesebacteria bacterium]
MMLEPIQIDLRPSPHIDLSPSFFDTVKLQRFGLEEEHEFDARIHLAEAATNQFRYVYAVTSGLPSGQELQTANEHPRLAHHGIRHTRHCEKALKVLAGEIINYEPEIFEGEFGEKLLKAMMIAVSFHDADQLFSEYRNLTLPEEERLKVKKGHAMAAAVQILALTDLYAESTGITSEEAREITGMAAVMMMRHDEPGTVSRGFSPESSDASKIQDPSILLKAYQSDELNLSTLSPAQMITILKAIKGDAGFIGRDSSKYGLTPKFEQDLSVTLQQMADENTNPILRLDSEQQHKLKAGTEMFIWADLVDMVSPYWDAIFRTFQGQYSKERPFSWSYCGDSKNLPPEVDILFSHVLNPENGNGTVNDVERLLWELYNLDDFARGTVLEQIPFVQEFSKEHSMMGAIAVREVAQAMYGGDQIENVVRVVYANRVKRLNETARSQNHQLHTSRYWDQISHFDEEARDMIMLLHNKEPNSESKDKDYQYFNYIYQIFLRMLRQKYNVTDEEFIRYDAVVQSGESALTQLLMFTPDALPPANASLTVLDPEKFAKSVH